ncbi:hypothetical protein MYRNA_1 [Mycobacterium phage Myrna]|uniref:HIT domain-containing protein n=1 Tax=Mycobacterium phage Myrna TaxID=546805 RepID=B5LJ12_9CAUD|nr:gp1 [Mycobacterium phage Myrna]ACH62009.1 hypothetical protein MYRNA_1 [Mycobacterium phage Myrna]
MDLSPARDDYGFKDTNCVFCIPNWDKLDIIERTRFNPCEVAVINPLKPVTEGHVLVIAAIHTKNASEQPWSISALLMSVAGEWVRKNQIESANIITSIGEPATQSVFHTHVHVVPRKLNDDLPLPWTPQQMEEARWKEALEANILHRMAARAKAAGDRYDAEQAEKLKSLPHIHGGLRP